MNKHSFEVRYSGDFGRSLFGTFPSFETATIAARIFKTRCVVAGLVQLAKSVSVE